MAIQSNGQVNSVAAARKNFKDEHAAVNSVQALKATVLQLARRVAELEKKLLGVDEPVE